MRKEKQNLFLTVGALSLATLEAESPINLRVSYDCPYKIKQGEITLATSVLEVVTAVATATSAVLLLVQVIFARAQAAPFIQAKKWIVEGDVTCYYLFVHPGDTPLQIRAISTRNALIAPAKFATSPTGDYLPVFSAPPVASRIQLSVAVPPRKVSEEPVRTCVLLKALNSSNAMTISLHSRIWLLPTKYKITVMTNSER